MGIACDTKLGVVYDLERADEIGRVATAPNLSVCRWAALRASLALRGHRLGARRLLEQAPRPRR
jgi:hypothetical protein